MERRAQLLELQNLVIQLFARGLVAGQNREPARQQHANERPVRNADAEHRDALAAQTIKICRNLLVHGIFLF